MSDHGQPCCCQVPEFRVSMSMCTDKLDTLYAKLKPAGVTMTALLAKACGVALAGHPTLHAGALHLWTWHASIGAGAKGNPE